MTPASPTFLGRSDTFLGICEALGQDLGFNANILRIAIGIGVLFAPVAVVASYALLGLAVWVSRIMVPLTQRPIVEATAHAYPVNDRECDDDKDMEHALAA